jgi:hypothetical protein
MTGLLSEKDTSFNRFLLNEAVIVTGHTFTLDGHLNKAFFTEDELEQMQVDAADKGLVFSEELIRWESVKGFCYECIKGRKTPLSLKVILSLPPEEIKGLLAKTDTTLTFDDILAMNINIKFDGSVLTCTTAVSLKIFTMDRSADRAFDEMFAAFLTAHSYDYD